MPDVKAYRVDRRPLRFAAMTPVLFQTPAGPRWHLTLHDQTESVETRLVLNGVRSLLDAVLENAPLVLFITDHEGVFSLVGGGAFHALRGRLVGRSVFEVYEDHAQIVANFRRALAGEIVSDLVSVQDTSDTLHYECVYLPDFAADGRTVRRIIGVGLEVTNRVDTERALADQTTELTAAKKELQAVLHRFDQAQEEDRRRLARDVHDVLGGLATALRFDVAWLKRHTGTEAQSSEMRALVLARCERVEATLAELSTAIRSCANQLRPSVLDDFGLTYALTNLAARFQQRTSVACTTSVEKADPATLRTLPKMMQTAVYRIAEEALTNVARHANAENVRVSIATTAETVSLRVEDDGVGLSTNRGAGASDDGNRVRLGLVSMRERASIWNGTLRVEPGRCSDYGGSPFDESGVRQPQAEQQRRGVLVEAILPLQTVSPAAA
ncbi:MAG: ATP-binding protein [Bacteroidota bacterium]